MQIDHSLKALHTAYNKHCLMPVATAFTDDRTSRCTIYLCSCGGLWGHSETIGNTPHDNVPPGVVSQCDWRYVTNNWQASILSIMRHNKLAMATWLGLPYRTYVGQDVVNMWQLELRLGLSKALAVVPQAKEATCV